MFERFTEKQYQRVVEIADKYQSKSGFGIIGDTDQKSLGAEFYGTELSSEIEFYKNAKEMMAIANPLTREWAHDKFVEKKYYWSSKKQSTTGGFVTTLYKDGNGMIATSYRLKKVMNNHKTNHELTESEIREWGYNPDMFDKEEVL